MDGNERQIKRTVLEHMDRCMICHRSFEPDDVHVISRKPDVWMMVVNCGDCHARNFVAALIGDGDVAAARSALRRLSAEHDGNIIEIEPEPIPRNDPVSAGEVVEMHEFLQSFDGDFKRLFSPPREPSSS